ncbi:hypothetical protein KY284_000401 [Solanum tuberosum]|nr:hypothetical protein KY284_000401 [Solanum tuberosum]
MNNQGRELTLGETTLEDYLVKAGLFVADASLGHTMSLDNPTAMQNFMPPIGLSPSPSLSDTPVSDRKRGASDIDKTIDRRLRRKIKNRESAARSRARKQAYHNELVNKVSHLEEENMKLKKEKLLLFRVPFFQHMQLFPVPFVSSNQLRVSDNGYFILKADCD